jgi:outer membrane protein assembly factor BamD (BamD/ComL family)
MFHTPRHLNILIMTVCIISAPLCAAATVSQSKPLKLFEINHPRCESQSVIETAHESFTTIANDLPGRNEYNELVKTFHRGQWEQLDSGIEGFEGLFETSPLREAVAFLKVESLFDRIDRLDSPLVKEAEKGLRSTILLYPKSKLIPIVQGTVGAFWLRNGLYQKSLSVFMTTRQEYPLHSLNCFFQFGIAESNFLLHDRDAAKKGFKALLQKCNNPRFSAGASLRLIGLEYEFSPEEAGKKLEGLYQQESSILSRFYPDSLYNLGEVKFQKREYTSAKFYFNEYLKQKNQSPECAPFASKRLADIAGKTKMSTADVIGAYLQNSDQFPKTDAGRFSRVEAMLRDYPQKPRGEKERRTLVIDETIADIKDTGIRQIAALNKGLVLLDSGEKGAIAQLQKILKNGLDESKRRETSEIISSRLFQILKKESEEALAEDLKNESFKNEDLFRAFEDNFTPWLRKTPIEKEARVFYSELIFKRFKEFQEKEDWKAAFDLIQRWKQSTLWEKNEAQNSMRLRLGKLLCQRLMSGKVDEVSELNSSLIENENEVSDFLGEEFEPLFLAAHAEAKDNLAVIRWLKKMTSHRNLASQKSKLEPEVRDFLTLKKVEGFYSGKNYKGGLDKLQAISTKKYKDEAIVLKIQGLYGMKRYADAIEYGSVKIQKIQNKEAKQRALASLTGVVNDSKSWDDIDFLVEEARGLKLSGKPLAQVLFVAGKAESEQKQCKKAIKFLGDAMAADGDSPGVNEARFRMGKCYKKEKQGELAKKQWQSIVDSKDSFWAPMAKSELKLMEEP